MCEKYTRNGPRDKSAMEDVSNFKVTWNNVKYKLTVTQYITNDAKC